MLPAQVPNRSLPCTVWVCTRAQCTPASEAGTTGHRCSGPGIIRGVYPCVAGPVGNHSATNEGEITSRVDPWPQVCPSHCTGYLSLTIWRNCAGGSRPAPHEGSAEQPKDRPPVFLQWILGCRFGSPLDPVGAHRASVFAGELQLRFSFAVVVPVVVAAYSRWYRPEGQLTPHPQCCSP